MAARYEGDEEFWRFVVACMRYHSEGEWGEIEHRDKGTNEKALADGNCIIWTYTHTDKTRYGLSRSGIARPPWPCSQRSMAGEV